MKKLHGAQSLGFSGVAMIAAEIIVSDLIELPGSISGHRIS